MNNRELGIQLGKIILEECKITNEVLRLIQAGLERRAYLEHGFSSMFEWLTRGFGYSNAAAYRRIEAARLLRAVPEAADKLEKGTVNLTTLSRAQTAIRAQEKTGTRITAQEKAEIVAQIEGKALPEAERSLFALLPEAKKELNRERKETIDENTTRLHINLPKEAMEHLTRAKEVLSHQLPNASDADILAYALKFLLEKKDPLQKPTSAAKAKCVIKRKVLQKAQAACTYKDPRTGRQCGSRYQIEIDHIRPRALGGGDEPENLRALCRAHNHFRAEQTFRREFRGVPK